MADMVAENVTISRTMFRDGVRWIVTLARPLARFTKSRTDDVVVVLLARMIGDEPTFQAVCDTIGLAPDKPAGFVIGRPQPGAITKGLNLSKQQVREGLTWIQTALGPVAVLTPTRADDAVLLLVSRLLADDKAFYEFTDALGVTA